MSQSSPPALSVSAMFADREARRQREREAEEQLRRKETEEAETFRHRLDEFRLTDANIAAVGERIRGAFDRGESELMLTSFPSSFCSDGGRTVNNADLPPINKPAADVPAGPPAWIATMPRGAALVYGYWEKHLKPGGFGFSARIINYPGGMPGDVGLFLSWPKSSLDQQSP